MQSFSIVYFVALILIFYLLIIRPQQQKVKRHDQLVNSLAVGDRVIITGGIYGTIIAMEEEIFIIKIAENVEIKVLKQSIAAKQSESQ